MSSIVLGVKPDSLEVNLDSLADFDATLYYAISGTPTDWPVGTVWKLVFATGVTWSTTLDDDEAIFHEDKAVTALIPTGTKVKLVYNNGSTDRVLARGTVSND